MEQYYVRYMRKSNKGLRCVNPSCRKKMEPREEKYCPKCGKWSVENPYKRRCDDCGKLLVSGDRICPLCGSKQRQIVELRRVNPENLTTLTHLLQEVCPRFSLARCREICRGITVENPYRVLFAGRMEQMRPFIQTWNAYGGMAVPCLSRETSQRPVVVLRSYNRRQENAHARLLYEAIRKSDRPTLSFGDTVAMLHGLLKDKKPVSICFTTDFDRIDAWVAEWKKLGGTAVRSSEHRIAGRADASASGNR